MGSRSLEVIQYVSYISLFSNRELGLIMDESHLLDEHVFEEPKLLHRDEKVAVVTNLIILLVTILLLFYCGLHLNLLTLALVFMFVACMFINCIFLGKVLTRRQEQRILSGEQFQEYVVGDECIKP